MAHPLDMHPYDDLNDLRNANQIPLFDKHGTALSQSERAAIAKRRGQCLRCGVKTHDIKVFKRAPLTNEHVHAGTCIRCNPEGVPAPVLAKWDAKFGNQQKKPSSRAGAKMRATAHTVGLAAVAMHRSSEDRSERRHTHLQHAPSDHGLNRIPSGGGNHNHSNKLYDATPRSYRRLPSAPRLGQPKHPPLQLAPTQEDYTGGISDETAWDIVAALRDSKVRDDPYQLKRKLHRLRNLGEDGQIGALYEVQEIMDRYIDDPSVMAVACGTMWGITCTGDDKKNEACDAGVIQVVVESLRIATSRNIREPDYYMWTFGLLECLARGTDIKAAIGNAGGIDVMVRALHANSSSGIVFEWACRALHSLVYQYDIDVDDEYRDLGEKAIRKNIAIIDDAGGVTTVMSALKDHIQDTVGVEWALKLIWRMLDRDDDSSTKKVLKKIKDEDGVASCVDVLKARSTTPESFEMTVALLCELLAIFHNKVMEKSATEGIFSAVRIMKDEDNQEIESLQEGCCEFLATLAAFGKESKRCIDEAHGIVAVIQAMMRFPSNRAIQEAGSWLLWSFSLHPSFDLQQNLPHALYALNMATDEHIDSARLQAGASAFMANIAAAQITDASDLPIEIPIRALSVDTHDPTVHEQACRALAYLAVQSPDRVIESSIVNKLIEAAAIAAAEAQDALLFALHSIASSSEASRNALISTGCLDVAVDMLQRSDSDSSAGKALELISALTATDAHQRQPLPANIVQTILDVMRTKLHGGEACQRACILLRNLLLGSSHGAASLNVDGIVDSMTAILDSFSEPVDLKREACGVLWALVAKQPQQSVSVLSTMFNAVLGAMVMYKGEEQPYNSDLQSEGGGALAMLTWSLREHSYPLESTAVDSVIAIMYMILEFDVERTEVLEKVLDAILNLSIIDEGTVIQCGGIVVVIDAMVEHETDESIQERGCSILAVLSSTENLQVNLCIAETDGIDMIVSALAVFTENQRIQVDACKALSHLSVDHESRMLIGAQGGLILVVNSMNKAGNRDNVDLLEGACSTLLNLSSDADEQALADTSIIQTIVDVMRYHPDAQQLQEKGLGVLQNVAMRNITAKRGIAQAGGIAVVTSVIKEFMGAPSVLERAFTTMWSLAVLEQNQILIADSGGIGLVVNGMMANINYDKVQKQGCGCLCTLSSNSRNKNLIRDAGGVDAIVFAMWAHYDSETLQVEACRALSSLAVNVQTNEVMIATDGEISAIISAMRRFPNSSKLQEHACVALRNFMLSADNAVLIRSNTDELIGLMTRAANQFPDLCAERANQVLASLG